MDLKESYSSKNLEEFQKDFYTCMEDKEKLKKEIFAIFRAQYYKWKNDENLDETNIVFSDNLNYLLQYDAQELQGECKEAWLKDLEENADEIYKSLYAEEDDRDYDFCEQLEFYGEEYEDYEKEKIDDEEYERWREEQNDFEYALMDKIKEFKWEKY